MEKWLKDNLSRIIDFPVENDWIDYMMAMESERDFEEYLSVVLDRNNGEHRTFIAEAKRRLMASKNQIGYKKVNDADNVQKKPNERKKGKSKGKERQENKQVQEVTKAEKHKITFVPLCESDGKDKTAVLLKGRHKCNCEAQKHALVNNCRTCGRIVCTQEGAGPCYFCNEPVYDAKQVDNSLDKSTKQKPTGGLDESIRQRDKLLEYGKTGSQLTKVIDDELDYYQSNNIWLDAKQREKLKALEESMNAKRHTLRSSKTKNITVDFMARKVVEEDDENDYDYEMNEEEIRAITESFDNDETFNICPDIKFARPMYIESKEADSPKQKTKTSFRGKGIVQDKEYLEMSDSGLCLSMHQPYASLLVAGIKVHEGRIWYTSHRGRLWIASTAKTPTREDIETAEQFYRALKDGEKIVFPEAYPTSSLLGHVNVADVLIQEEYKKCYPAGESHSPYVFICENPFVLPIKFPIQGKHKIYKLDDKIHHAALKISEKCRKI